ncbi:MAG: sulfatase-like hydrolase/transferase [Oligoflexia bacterium]|nr:sulfatase-like hydrolase/transferase [Oligoflexia bacterium]
MDALQAKRVSHLGYPRETTPNIDNLAKLGISFSQAISPASWTVPTYLSIFTSVFPSKHGLTNRFEVFNEGEKKISNVNRKIPNIITIADFFKSHGYRTGAFTGDAGVSAVLGYDKGFDIYTDETQFGGIDNSIDHAIKWIKKDKKKFFLFLHGYDSHGQYHLQEQYKGKYFTKPDLWKKINSNEQAKYREMGLSNKDISLSKEEIRDWNDWYDSKIFDADKKLENFLNFLDKEKLRGNTNIVLLSDHGTEVFEHKKFDHGHTLYDELIQVPLIFVLPKMSLSKGTIIKKQVSTMDVFPTLIEVSGLTQNKDLKEQIKGASLIPLIKSKEQDGHTVFSETDYRNFTHKRAIRTKDGWKYILTIENGTDELYDLNSDPKELINLHKKEAKKNAELRKLLMEHISKTLGGVMNTGKSNCLPVYKGQCE